MARTVLLTLGRLPKALTLARCLKAQGCRVVVAEPFNWHLCKPSNAIDQCWITPPPNLNPGAYRERLRNIIAAEAIDVVVPISEESQYVLCSSTGDASDLGAPVLGPSAVLYSQLQDKWLFVQHAMQRHVSVPHSTLADANDTTDFHAATVSKPRRGCSGLGVTVHDQCPNPTGLPEGTLLQQYVEGTSCSSLSLLEKGAPLATVLYRPRVNTGTVAVCFESIPIPEAVNDWISAFCAGLDYTGFIAFDFIIDAAGVPWGVECNPRLTSGIHFFDDEFLARWVIDTGAALADSAINDRPALSYDTSPLHKEALKPTGQRYQWGYSTLTEAWASLFNGKPAEALQRLNELRSARDVVWSWRDPLPFLLMTPMSWPILWPAISGRMSMAEASQRDIAPLFDKHHGASENHGLNDSHLSSESPEAHDAPWERQVT